MARSQVVAGQGRDFEILEDGKNKTNDDLTGTDGEDEDQDMVDEREESESDCSSGSEDDAGREISPAVADDIARFEDSFKDLGNKYRLIDRIGEGTFSTVYKAEDLQYEKHLNDWDLNSCGSSWASPPVKGNGERSKKQKHFVAIKKIYVTSSPARIQNELELLYDLRNCKAICPLITAFRYQDQVVAVLPYYRHRDFRVYYRDMLPSDMQTYFRSLFTALAAVHRQGILHRDIKPTNFLYDPRREQGVLVDFGLAERMGTDSSYCICVDSANRRRAKLETSYAAQNNAPSGYPKNDTRPSRRANRAGTRGFRAPEVLFKCPSQTTKIDIWSAGVILLTILAQRFPFFNSTDDVDAMVEIASIFGRKRMHSCAVLHGCCFDCTLPSIGDKGFPFEKLILWSTCKESFTPGETMAIRLLERCLELDPKKRITAKEALQHEFLQETTTFEEDTAQSEDEINMVGA